MAKNYSKCRNALLEKHLANVEDLETRYYGITGFHAPSDFPSISSHDEFKRLMDDEEARHNGEVDALTSECQASGQLMSNEELNRRHDEIYGASQ